MCGIAGFLSNGRVAAWTVLDAVRRVSAHMQSRGPDAQGEYAEDAIVLAHRRLAIVDLDARANQPMRSADGRYVIVYNGEIYNFRALRRTLQADGMTFRTTSDTEVLLALYAREGEAMLHRLRGMFAFAVWDTVTSELFLARDPYGIKPLYTANDGWTFRFASQVKALLAGGMISRDPDVTRLVDRLSRRGLVSRVRGRQDRRVVEVGITDKGRELLKSLDSHVDRMPRAMIGHLGPRKLEQLRHLLEALIADLGTFP